MTDPESPRPPPSARLRESVGSSHKEKSHLGRTNRLSNRLSNSARSQNSRTGSVVALPQRGVEDSQSTVRFGRSGENSESESSSSSIIRISQPKSQKKTKKESSGRGFEKGNRKLSPKTTAANTSTIRSSSTRSRAGESIKSPPSPVLRVRPPESSSRVKARTIKTTSHTISSDSN